MEDAGECKRKYLSWIFSPLLYQLSYPANMLNLKRLQGFDRLCLRWTYFFRTKRDAARSHGRKRAVPRVSNQPNDRDDKRLRGIWYRGGRYFAQINVAGAVKQVPLQGEQIVADAVTPRQVLKGGISRGWS